MNNWKLIESAPKDGTYVLVCEDNENMEVSAFRYGAWTSGYYPSLSFNPTHWMPLPEAPTK